MDNAYIAYASMIIGLILGIIMIVYGYKWLSSGSTKGGGLAMTAFGVMVIISGSVLAAIIDDKATNPIVAAMTIWK